MNAAAEESHTRSEAAREQRSLAAVFSHPDDETFATGGTIARYAAARARITLFTATDGDAGKSSGIPVASRAELGALRRNELYVAARQLGIRELECAGHPDGALEQVPPELLVGQIVAFLRRERPLVVLTFGPEGAPTGHRDHKAISRAATAAFFLARNPTAYPELGEPWAPARLYYVTWPVPAPGAELQIQGLPATVQVDVREWLHAKENAFRAHVTQRQHEARFRELALTPAEWYALAAGTPQPADVVDDLFVGL